MSDLPTVTCLCPTYRRPKLLANAIACFEAQDYPKERRRLIVLDDAGELSPTTGEAWDIFSVDRRYPNLPAKFNALLEMAGDTNFIAIWEDDDIYMPWHLSASIRALVNSSWKWVHGEWMRSPNLWSKPSRVGSFYTGKYAEEPADGRFHASLVIRTQALRELGGWPDTKQGSFDLQLISQLTRVETPVDPLLWISNPGYVFRWGSTGAYHGQAYMKGPGDEGWYDRIPEVTKGPKEFRLTVVPEMDAETKSLYESLVS